MKYFVISDVHGFFDEMIKALDKVGFDRSNPQHILVTCGDNFDRGGQSIQILNYLLSLERKILIKGNHESLLEQLISRNSIEEHDNHNGTSGTANSFIEEYNLKDYRQIFPFLKPYFQRLVDYYETDRYIFVHSWIPENDTGCNYNWRDAEYSEWERARWVNPFEKAINNLNQTGKTIVFGHWHTSWMRALEAQLDRGAHYMDAKISASYNQYDFSNDIYFGNDFIGLDACSVYSKKVNVLVLED